MWLFSVQLPIDLCILSPSHAANSITLIALLGWIPQCFYSMILFLDSIRHTLYKLCNPFDLCHCNVSASQTMNKLRSSPGEYNGYLNKPSLYVLLEAADSLPPTLCNGNLSVLKKWWEQPVQSSATSCAPLPHTTHTRCLLPLNPKAKHRIQATQAQPPLSPDPNTSPTAAEDQAGPGMEGRLQQRDPERQEAIAEVPCVPSEKPNIPLNNLKMLFEKGENQQNKVSPKSLITN